MTDPRPKKKPTLRQLRNELDYEKYKQKYNKTLRSTVYLMIVVAAIAVLIATLVFPVFRIYGSSMSPTVKEGEIIVSLKGSSFETGDVIVLSFNNKLLVKRVIAGPGQWVDIDKLGNVYVDGTQIEEPYLISKSMGDCTIKLPYQVPDGRYFVMGDNRTVSQDSRNAAIGGIERDQIVGRALLRIWPLERLGSIEADFTDEG